MRQQITYKNTIEHTYSLERYLKVTNIYMLEVVLEKDRKKKGKLKTIF